VKRFQNTHPAIVMESHMSTAFSRSLTVLSACCLIVCGCGARPTEGATPKKAHAETQPNAEITGVDRAADGTAAWDCSNYAAGGVDYQALSAAYLFIGVHPMCTDKTKRQDFCKALTAREGFSRTESESAAAEELIGLAQSYPEEARAAYLQQHPKHAFEQAMTTCGLKMDQVRGTLVAEAESSIKAGNKATEGEDVKFLMTESPTTAKAIWARECAGHMSQITVGEGLDWSFKGNPTYAYFCKTTTSDANVAKAGLTFKQGDAQ
jgi:hypothetical protein